MQSVAVLIIGDEILRGEVRDENGPWLIERFTREDISVVRLVTVPDETQTIVQELQRLREVADAVIVSGGIGPTHDDQTRPAIAKALGRPLASHAEAVRRLRGFYGDRMTPAELAMAEFAEGARIVSGVRTPAFGYELESVYALPGVPFLFHDLADGIAGDFKATPLHRVELTTSLREGEIAPHLQSVQDANQELAIGSYPVCDAEGRWTVRIVLRAENKDQLTEAKQAIEQRLS